MARNLTRTVTLGRTLVSLFGQEPSLDCLLSFRTKRPFGITFLLSGLPRGSDEIHKHIRMPQESDTP